MIWKLFMKQNYLMFILLYISANVGKMSQGSADKIEKNIPVNIAEAHESKVDQKLKEKIFKKLDIQ